MKFYLIIFLLIGVQGKLFYNDEPITYELSKLADFENWSSYEKSMVIFIATITIFLIIFTPRILLLTLLAFASLLLISFVQMKAKFIVTEINAKHNYLKFSKMTLQKSRLF